MGEIATERIETVIVGGGQAGLALSYYLAQHGRDHVVLEQAAQAGSAWRDRWDSFTLVTPNWQFRMPGAEYAGENPDGFLPRDEVIAFFEDYARRFHLPARLGARVNGVEQTPRGFCVSGDGGTIEAANVVIATGTFQRPRRPSFSADFPRPVAQRHSSGYRNPGELPPGAVLVIGSGQSGCQIAEELYLSGRKVYLGVGASSGRVPRRYRGQDCAWWLDQIGYYDRLVDPALARFAANPHVSGARGGHTLNLHQFARDGVSLLGHLQGVGDGKLFFADNLRASLEKIDRFEADLIRQFEAFARRAGLDLPPADLPTLCDGYETEPITELDLTAAGIHSAIWATGYRSDFNWLNLPGLLDGDGTPLQKRGVTAIPGVYFLGLHGMHTVKSGLLFGVGDDAAHIAGHIESRRPTC